MTLIAITFEKRGGWDVVHYVGPINEDTQLHTRNLKMTLGSKVIFNFKDVSYVNSNGIRTWVLFLRDFAQGREIKYEECSPTVVTQLNMIPGFLGNARVESVYAPISCQDCNHGEVELYKAGSYPQSNTDVTTRTCPKCGGEMGLGDSVEEYFEFANRDP